MDKMFAGCALFLFADAIWPLVLAVQAATTGDYGGLILMPPISALITAAGVMVWKIGRS